MGECPGGGAEAPPLVTVSCVTWLFSEAAVTWSHGMWTLSWSWSLLTPLLELSPSSSSSGRAATAEVGRGLGPG